jgi:hypothetical protein
MADPRLTYLDTLKELNSTMADINNTLSTISKITSALKSNPWHIDLENAPSILKSFNPNNWPTGDQIMSKLTQLHSLYKTLDSAWKSIPEADQKNLQRPIEVLAKYHP